MKEVESFPDRIRTHDTYMIGDVRWFVIATRFRQISSYGEIEVPAFFHSDGASIPKIFHTIVHPFGPYFGSALIHDFLYSKESTKKYGHITRKTADEIFLEGMYNMGVPWYKRNPMFRSVRLFGWRSYKKR